MKLPWQKIENKFEEKGFEKELKDGEAITSYDMKHRTIIIRFHNQTGGVNLPFSFIKEAALAIAKIEEHGIAKDTNT